MSATMEMGFTLRPAAKAEAKRIAAPVERGSKAGLGLLLLTLSGAVSVTAIHWMGSMVLTALGL